MSVLEDESSPKRPRLFCVFCAFLRLNPALPFVVFRPDASVALFWAAEVGGALTRHRDPFRLSPRIHISPTLNCTPILGVAELYLQLSSSSGCHESDLLARISHTRLSKDSPLFADVQCSQCLRA